MFSAKLPDGESRQSIITKVLKIAWPTMVEYLLVHMVNMFDQIQVSSLGENATAAVGVSSQIQLLVITVFMAANVGVTAMVARSFGSKEYSTISEYFRHGLILVLGFLIPWSVLIYLFTPIIINSYGIKEGLANTYAIEYLRICILGFFPMSLTMVITAALRGIGDTKTPMIYNTVANIINVIFNYLLIKGRFGFPKMEVRGAAIATCLGHFVAFCLALLFVLKEGNILKFEVKTLFNKCTNSFFSNILRIGVPSMIAIVIVRIGLAVFTSFVTALGTTIYATHVICQNIQALTFMFGQAISAAATTLTGQALGARKNELAIIYFKSCAILSFVIAIGLGLIYGFGGKYIIPIYNENYEIVKNGIVPLQIAAIMQPFSMLLYTLSGTLNGAGDTKVTALLTTLTTFIFRPLMAKVCINVLSLGLAGAWLAVASDQILCCLLLSCRFLTMKWTVAFKEKRGGQNE